MGGGGGGVIVEESFTCRVNLDETQVLYTRCKNL